MNKVSCEVDNKGLIKQVENLKTRLQELEEAIGAIRTGEVDALVVSTIDGDKVFTLKSAEQPYRIFIEEMNQGAIMLSEEDIILYCNRAFANIVKEKPEKIVGKKIQNYISNSDTETFNHMLNRSRLERSKTESLFAIKTSDGSHLSTQISANLVFQDNITTICLVVTDLTVHMQDEVKRYTEKLEFEVQERTRKLADVQRLAAIGETAGMVGHDIRNPLQSIVSEIFLARGELEKPIDSNSVANLVEALENIEEQTFYINKIVADLQDYTKPLAPKLQKIGIKEAVTESISNLVVPRNVSVAVDINNDEGKLEVDPLYLKRILINLVSNALQAMPDGGSLRIKVAVNGDNAKIRIADTGPGMPDNVKSQIFKPLFTTKAKGQGLGLAVVKRLVEALNGSVAFESQVGKGTTFIVTLPISKINT